MDKQKTAEIGHDWRTEHPPSAPRIEEWGSAPAPRPSIVFSQAEAEAQDAAHGWYVAPGDSLNSGWVVAPDKREMEPTKMPSEKAWRHISAIAPAVGNAVGNTVALSGLGRHDGDWLITGLAMGLGEPEIPVTLEMYDAGCAFLAAEGISGDRITSEYILDNIYPAMAVVAPERKRAADLEATNTLALSKIAELEADHFRLVTALNESHKRIGELLAQVAAFTAAPVVEAKEFPAAALRPSRSDPRRIGG